MTNKSVKIDLVKLALYIMKRFWLVVLCGVIGFTAFYWRANAQKVDTYTANGTMYVYNGNPNVVNYQYTNTADLNSAVQLLDTYIVVVKSNKVLEAVADRLIPDYPGITPSYIASTVYMGSIAETGVVRVSCTTDQAQKSADICNAVLNVAPAEIIRVVSAGNIEIIDYATPPLKPDSWSPLRSSLIGAAIGVVGACLVLFLIFLINQSIANSRELTEDYIPPVLASIQREKSKSKDPSKFVLTTESPLDLIESYAKLRMNLLYTLVGKESHAVVVTSSFSGEGKTTIAANLAISSAMGGKHVLLIDADMRRSSQREMFHFPQHVPGLSNVLIGECTWQEALIKPKQDGLDILPSGQKPPNPAELLESSVMHELLSTLNPLYDLIIIDAPPVNIVSDPLALSDQTAGSLFVVRQNFSDHKELRKALNSAELTGMNVLGFVFYGEKVNRKNYYYHKYYRNYYNKYDPRVIETANLKAAAMAAKEAEHDRQKAKDGSQGAGRDAAGGSHADGGSRRG